MLTQFTGKAYGVDTNGMSHIVEVRNKELIGIGMPQKFLFGTVFWFFHIVSDMAGSSSNPGAGTGLPGPLLAFAQKLSAMPFFKNVNVRDNSLSEWISKLFNGQIVKDIRFDLRTELGVAYNLGRQATPIMLNECIVRGFYFIRRFVEEIREKDIKTLQELEKIDWKKVLPFKNRTVIRMLTIATSTFTALDIADAAIRGVLHSAITSGGNAPVFAAQFLRHFVLRVNFVGVGRLAIAIGSDVYMGIQQNRNRNEIIKINSERLHFLNAKVFYKQADMWIEASNTNDSILKAINEMEKALYSAYLCVTEIYNDVEKNAVNEIVPVDKKHFIQDTRLIEPLIQEKISKIELLMRAAIEKCSAWQSKSAARALVIISCFLFFASLCTACIFTPLGF